MIHRTVVSLEIPDEDHITPDQVAISVESLLAYTLVSSSWQLQSVLPLRPPVAR